MKANRKNGIGKFPLKVLLWEATLRCNARCEFCGSSCVNVKNDEELTTEEICNTLKKISEQYDATKIMLNVSGGEPLMREDFFDVMKFADELGYKWGLVTNGTLLDRKNITNLAASKLRTVAISIDGTNELHDSIRGLSGGFKKIDEALDNLWSVRTLETIMITTVVSKRNINHLNEIKEYLLKKRINVWRICLVDPIGRATEHNDISLDDLDVRRVLEFIKQSRDEKLPFSVTTSCSHYLGEYEGLVRRVPFQCYAGKQIASILANGDIFVCPDVQRVPELIQGNVRKNDFVEVWENGFQVFRDDEMRKKGKCEKCTYYHSCRGDSVHTWDFKTNSPLFCMKDYKLEPKCTNRDIMSTTIDEVLNKYRINMGKIKAKKINVSALSDDIILFSPNAFKDIILIFEWGEKTEKNSNEQIACLLGNIYFNSDIKHEAFIVEITRVIELSAKETSSHLMIAELKWLKESEEYIKDTSNHLLGFVHSHPNDLSVAMSKGDYQWHKLLYEIDWKLALSAIINPQKHIISTYAGPAAEKVSTYFLLE